MERERTSLRAPRRGLTLTELLVVVTLLTTVVGTLLISLLVGQASHFSAEAYVQVQQEVRRAFDHMVKELREAGRVNNDVAIAEPGAQRLDFQIVQGYDAVACGGICWGTDDAAFPTGWIHYVVDATDPQHARLMRCATASRLDAMPTGFVGCRVLANSVNADPAQSAFTYDAANGIITLKIQTAVVSGQLPGGSLRSTPVPVTTRVSLRNS